MATALFYSFGLVVFTLLCQVSRHGLHGDATLEIKHELAVPANCSPSYFLPVTLPNGTVTLQQGFGHYECDDIDSGSGKTFTIESWVLELMTVIFAIMFSMVEYRDLRLFVTELLGRERLREEQMHEAARPPLLHPIPGEVRPPSIHYFPVSLIAFMSHPGGSFFPLAFEDLAFFSSC